VLDGWALRLLNRRARDWYPLKYQFYISAMQAGDTDDPLVPSKQAVRQKTSTPKAIKASVLPFP
jgi:hypothetical protein